MTHVLLVDDDAFSLSYLVEGLAAFAPDVSVSTAGDGEQARRILDEQGIDLVVTDLNMPGVDGFALAAHVLLNHPATPVVVTTGLDSPELLSGLKQIGIRAFLRKPVDPEVLAREVAGILAARPSPGVSVISPLGFLFDAARLKDEATRPARAPAGGDPLAPSADPAAAQRLVDAVRERTGASAVVAVDARTGRDLGVSGAGLAGPADVGRAAVELVRAAARAAGALGAGSAPERLLVHLDGGGLVTVSRSELPGVLAVSIERAGGTPEARAEADLASDARVLLAEDDPVNQKVGLAMLRRLGCRVDLAADGREAVDSVSRNEYDVALLDLQMPNMGGLEACREIRALTLRAQPRIVAMTADPSAEHHAACTRAGADELIDKPVKLETLREVVARSTIPSLDAEVFSRLRQLQRPGRDVVGDLTGNFLNGLPARLSDLAADVASDTSAELARHAHSLRSAAATFGAARMSALATRLESDARSGPSPDAERIVAELGREASVFRRLVLEELGKSAGGVGA